MKKIVILMSIGASILLANNFEQRGNMGADIERNQMNQVDQHKRIHNEQNMDAEKQRILSKMDERKDCITKAASQEALEKCHGHDRQHNNEPQRRANEQYSR